MRNQVLGNRYRILSLIGEGGMASVYKAQDMKLERRVAIKVLHSHLAQNEEIRTRFQQEARALSGIEHPNVLKVYDFSGADSKQLWIVMEILKGQSLADFVRNFSKSALHPILAAIITQEVCKALAQAHNQGIVHRDVKPDNIMVLNDGRIKLMDFGIAKDFKNHSMTMTGTFMGSPSYMSPEQIRGRDIDHRSDIYSLGVMLYEIITGVLPFTAGSTADVINKIIVGKYMEPAQVINGVPPELNSLVVQAMAQEPFQRPHRVDEVMAELSGFLSKHGFVESHIELERFFRDRASFESRLRKLHFTSGRSRSGKTINESVMRTNTTQALPTNYRAPTDVIPPPRQTTAHQATALERSATRHAAPRSTQINANTRIDRATVTDRRRMKHPLRVGRRASDDSSNPIERLVGVAIVAAMVIAAITSFVTFTDVFAPREVSTPVPAEASKTVDPKVEIKKEAPPSDIAPVEAKPEVTTTVTKPVEPVLQPKTPVRPKMETRRPKVAPRSETKATTRSTTTSPQSVTTTPVTTGTPAVPQAKTPQAAPITTVADTPAATPRTSTATHAQITFIAQPAAEIMIDGKSFGTTNDTENRRRGVRLTPGSHRLELRRRGYVSMNRNILVEAGDVKTLNFKLEREATTRLSISSNRSPVKLNIEEKGGNGYRRDMTMTRDSIHLTLPPGTYRIRVEYGNQTIERNITLTPGREALTFAAEFKEE